ncbi:MAG TPA: hypothetical protein VFZ47_05685 [Chitinophagaceae bacterium]
MRQNALIYGCLLLAMASLSSCELIEGIFKAGVWVGILIVVGIVALAIWLISRFRRK